MNVRQKLLLEVTKDDKIYIHMASTKLSNLEVKRSDGRPLFVAPTKLIYSDPDWTDVKDVVEKEKQRGGNPIVIFLKRADDKENNLTSWLEEIDITWTEEIGNIEDIDSAAHGSSNEKVRDKPITRQGSMQDAAVLTRIMDYEKLESNHYLELKTNDKYEISKVELLNAGEQPLQKGQFEELIKDKHDRVFRFEIGERPNYVKIRWYVGVPNMIVNWVWFGAIIGAVVPSIALVMMFSLPSIFAIHTRLIVQFVGAIVAALFGLRLLLFHDIELMRSWSKLYIILISFGIGATILLIFLFGVLNPSPINCESSCAQ